MEDEIVVDGKRVSGEAVVGGLSREAPQPRWVILYKPKGVTVTPGGSSKTVMSMVDDAAKDRLLPVGRLDRNTAGLILMTNEKIWLHPLTHPSYALGRRYIAVVDGVPKPRDLEMIEYGIKPDGYTKPIKATSAGIVSVDTKKRTWCKLELGFAAESSRPRDIRRMFESLGHPIRTLTRSSIGPFTISKEMKAGQWRELTEREIGEVKQTLRQKMAKNDADLMEDEN